MKRRTPDHPKTYDLAERLGVRRPYAIGYLELLWHFAAEFAPQGDIGRYSDARIEAACDWIGAKGRLIQALVDCKWVETSPQHRLIIHDWHDHADDSVRKRLHRSGLNFLTVPQKVTGQSPVTDGFSAASRARVAQPSLATPEPGPAASDVSDGQDECAAPEESPPPVDLADLARRKDMNARPRRAPLPWPVPEEIRACLSALRPDDQALARLWRECRTRDPTCTGTEVAYLCAQRERSGGLKRAENPIGLLLTVIPAAFADGGSALLRDFRRKPMAASG